MIIMTRITINMAKYNLYSNQINDLSWKVIYDYYNVWSIY